MPTQGSVMPSFEIFIPVSNQFQWELGPFFHFFDKHWSPEQPVTVLTARDPDLERADYVPVKEVCLVNEDWHFGRFSNGLIEFMRRDCIEPLVVLMNADYWLSRSVNVETFDALVSYMLEHLEVTRMAISVNGHTYRSAIPHEDWHGVTVMRCPEDNRSCFFPMSLLPAIWNRELWLKVLGNGWNPWETETRGHDAYIADDSILSMTVSEPPLKYHHAARTRAKAVYNGGISEEDWQIVETMVPEGFQILT